MHTRSLLKETTLSIWTLTGKLQGGAPLPQTFREKWEFIFIWTIRLLGNQWDM
jgi:hypothetical protein